MAEVSTRDADNFSRTVLAGYSKGLLIDTLDFIRESYDPGEVFGREMLEDWAKYNGFVKVDE